jgi:hypothetical protein
MPQTFLVFTSNDVLLLYIKGNRDIELKFSSVFSMLAWFWKMLRIKIIISFVQM